MRNGVSPFLTWITAALALGACSMKETDHSGTRDSTVAAKPNVATSATPAVANVVTITAHDYRFDAPASIPAGLTTIRLVSEGKELHHVAFVKLEDGKTVQDFAAALRNPGPPPAWMVEMGGVNPPRPGGTAEETQRLEPGNYMLACFVPGPDGKPHVAKGMMRAITVTPAAGPEAPDPTPDVVLTLTDYTFTLSHPLTAGKHVIRIDNAGKQHHELVLARLAPGKTSQDLAKWVDKMQGPPPGEPLGGITAIQPGEHGYITVDLTPGDYGFLCFLPDAKDGKPHVAHGMLQDIKI